MNRVSFLIAATLLIADPIRSCAQELNSWGDAFSCAVDWFGVCKEKRPDDSDKQLDPRRSTSSLPAAAANLPLPVRNVLENPSPESARAYVLWSRQTSEKLAKASEYIAQATREINSEASMFSTENKRGSDLALAGMGPVGL